MKKSLLFLIGILTSVTIQAYEVDFEYKDVTCRYDITGGSAKLISGPSTDATDIYIPPKITYGTSTEYVVTIIGKNAFKGNTNIIFVDIPEGVTTIEESAFNGCNQLRRINLPSTLGTIGTNAFQNCSRMAHICCRVGNPSSLNPEKLPSSGMVTLYVPKDTKEDYENSETWGRNYKRIYEG